MLLFTLLTKQHPAAASLRSPADLMKAIVEVEAPRASDAVEDGCIRRMLRGDLDTIIGKALKKKPSERYASVTELANELQRYLRHEPISARPDAIGYRAAKFVRRHRWQVAAAVLTVAVLSTALFVADRQRRLAERRYNQLRQLAGGRPDRLPATDAVERLEHSPSEQPLRSSSTRIANALVRRTADD